MLENNDNKIQLLPDFIANQIAAGEVVQKPESVVKELVENSLDAGADNIIVIVKNAGKSLIHIVDNGEGISEKDLPKTILRHATSKIFTTEDLEQINTYGFRGEAMASIASVAKIEIRTKKANTEIGFKMVSEPMKEPEIEPFLCDIGTQIFVKDLFYNVPARRKFLKSNLSEFRWISETMIKFALSRPDVRFIFYDDSELIFDCKKDSLENRIINLLGKEKKNNIIKVEHQTPFLEVSGFVGTPEIAKQGKSNQYFFLNGRSINSPFLAHAVTACFENIIEPSKRPFFVLNLNINPKSIDINVHPQKHEVKFEKERDIYNSVKESISKAISLGSLSLADPFNKVFAHSPIIIEKDLQNQGQSLVINKLTGEIYENEYPKNLNNPRIYNSNSNAGFSNSSQFDSNHSPKSSTNAFEALFEAPKDNSSINKFPNIIKSSSFKVSAKIAIIQASDSCVVVNIPACLRRVLYDKAFNRLKSEKSASQELMFPSIIDISEVEKNLIVHLESNIQNVGFRYEIKGAKVYINSIPSEIREGEESYVFKGLLEDFQLDEYSELDLIKKELALRFSRRGFKSLIDTIKDADVYNLLMDVSQSEYWSYCPNGERTLRELNSYYLEGLLKTSF